MWCKIWIDVISHSYCNKMNKNKGVKYLAVHCNIVKLRDKDKNCIWDDIRFEKEKNYMHQAVPQLSYKMSQCHIYS